MVMDPVTLFNQLEKAATDVASTHKDWLAAIKLYLVDPNLQIKQDVKKTLDDNKIVTVSADQALRVALEEAASLQILSVKLATTIARLNSDQLAKAFEKSAKYLFDTDEEFRLLQLISKSNPSPQDVKNKFNGANTARNGDTSQSQPPNGLLQVVNNLSTVISLVIPQPCTDKFLEKMDSSTPEYTETRELLQSSPDTRTFDLTSEGVGKLIDSWGDVVNNFVSGAEKFAASSTSKFGSPSTIADFFCIHGSLETLYDRLTTNVDLKA